MNQQDKLTAYNSVQNSLETARTRINTFCQNVLRTRGGRIGSGMGSLLEAIWGYEINFVLKESGNTTCELAWFPDHQYHDFACVKNDHLWVPATGEGEYFRVEAKSMNSGADESKAHFDVLTSELNDLDALLLLVWEWVYIDEFHCCPQVTGCFFAPAKPIINLRDTLHIQRGGTFVDKNYCPDGCLPVLCPHNGEPLNVNSNRERISGPRNTKPLNVSHSANFGGLIRMLKTSKPQATMAFRQLRIQDPVINSYISFIHKHFPYEELHHFSVGELQKVSKSLGLNTKGLKKIQLHTALRLHPNYPQFLLNI